MPTAFYCRDIGDGKNIVNIFSNIFSKNGLRCYHISISIRIVVPIINEVHLRVNIRVLKIWNFYWPNDRVIVLRLRFGDGLRWIYANHYYFGISWAFRCENRGRPSGQNRPRDVRSRNPCRKFPCTQQLCVVNDPSRTGRDLRQMGVCVGKGVTGQWKLPPTPVIFYVIINGNVFYYQTIHRRTKTLSKSTKWNSHEIEIVCPVSASCFRIILI